MFHSKLLTRVLLAAALGSVGTVASAQPYPPPGQEVRQERRDERREVRQERREVRQDRRELRRDRRAYRHARRCVTRYHHGRRVVRCYR